MKRIRVASWAIVLGVAAGAAQAAPMGNLGPRGSLAESESLAPLSVGVDFEQLNRDVTVDGVGDTLKARSYTAYLGYDVAPWLTVYGTLGQVEAQLLSDGYEDGDPAWSVGVDAALWQMDVMEPAFLEGRLGLRAVAEYNQASVEEAGEDLSWNEFFAALTLNYEVFVDQAAATDRVPYSLILYAGPLYSALDGEQDAAGADIEEDSSFGFVLGADLFIAHNLSAGFSLQQFDNTSYHGGLRYHF